jgi:hypothetical protein
LDLPLKEGVNFNTNVSVLYHIKQDVAPKILEAIGSDYESVMILSLSRSKAANGTASYGAKDMYSGVRAIIEKRNLR